MDVIKVINTIATATKAIVSDENAQSFLCGTYADGTPRNLSDALHGEFLSPKQRKKALKKKKKKKKVKFQLWI